MSIVCARPDCVLAEIPVARQKLASFVTLLCAEGEGRHRQNSIHAHINCIDELAMSLVEAVGYIPYSYELVIAYDPQERKVSEQRAQSYYYCGQPACLVKLLRQYGNNRVKQLLFQAENDPEGALRMLPPVEERARRQLESAIKEVGRKLLVEQEVQTLRQAVWDLPGRPAVEKPAEPPAEKAVDAKNILVVGGGAVGTMLAGRLLIGGHDVVLVVRQNQASVLQPIGLQLQEGKRIYSIRPAAIVGSVQDAFPSGAEYDLMILAVKAYDAPEILKQLPTARFPLPRKVMTVQNGVGVEETAAKLLGPERVLAAALTTPVSVSSPGNVAIESKSRGLGLAPIVSGERIGDWVSLFKSAGITTRAYDDFRPMKWSKLLLNMVANATCAILGRNPSVIYGYRPTFAIEHAMLRETLAVMKKLGIPVVDLPGGAARSLAQLVTYAPAGLAQRLLTPRVERGRGEKMPSLYLDLAAGKKQSEVLLMNGAVVRYGQQVGVPTPVNHALTDTLHKLVTGLLLWEDFRGRPEALLVRVKRAKEEQA